MAAIQFFLLSFNSLHLVGWDDDDEAKGFLDRRKVGTKDFWSVHDDDDETVVVWSSLGDDDDSANAQW